MRWIASAIFMAELVVAPGWAQRAVPSGHAGGFSMPHGFTAPRVSGGFSSGTHVSSPPVMPRPNFTAPPQYRLTMPGRYRAGQPFYPGNNGNRNSPPPPDWHGKRPYHDHGSRYRQSYVPYFYARSTYLVPGLLNSYWDYPYDSYSDEQSGSYPAQGQAEDTSTNSSADPAPYEPQQMPDVPPPPPAPAEPLPRAAVTLVFKDGHSQQIHNYAMTKTTVYVLDDVASGRRPEIPIDRIDLLATEQANREAGVDFVLPVAVN
jgi:hypothetical protein